MPLQQESKQHTFIPAVLITLGVLILPIISLILLTQYNISSYPSSITPSEEFCIKGFFPFPNHYKVEASTPIATTTKDDTLILGKYKILSKQICLTPTTLLPEFTNIQIKLAYLKEINWDIFQKSIYLQTTSYPSLTNTTPKDINNDEILEYQTEYYDNFINYFVSLGDSSVPCTKEDTKLSCDISALNLSQGASYKLNLSGIYEGEIIQEFGPMEVNILPAVEVTSSTITNGQVVQNPSLPEIILYINKEVEDGYNIAFQDGSGNNIPFSFQTESQSIKIAILQTLTQNTSYNIKITNLNGKDGSHYIGEYLLQFSISDGPKIKYTNMGIGFSVSNNIVLTFDQNINKSQNIKNFVKFNSGTDYAYSIYNNQITINPNFTLDSCKSYSLSITKGILSTTGLVSTTSYTSSLKTKCQRVASVGTSVQGRAIYAYYFGTGSKKIVFFGSMHGTESNTKTLLFNWIDELEANNTKIPSDKTIIVVPTFNPDGNANRTRFNANGVDLNRNFPSSTWTAGTYFLSGYYPFGGGTSPLSEPESTAIKNLVSNQSPYLTVSYHAAAGYVIPSNTSYAISMGHTYSNMSGYSYVAPGASGAFTYDITGTFEEWMEEQGKNVLVVETSSLYSAQFSLNKNAMWKMVTE